MATVKVTFYLPIWDNDGSEIIEFAEELEDRLYDDSIMWTWNGYVCGTYRMPSGERCDDICQSFSLIVDESCVATLADMVVEYKKKTLQDSIYFEIIRGVELRYL